MFLPERKGSMFMEEEEVDADADADVGIEAPG